MVQPPSSPADLPADFDDDLGRLPAQCAAPAQPPLSAAPVARFAAPPVERFAAPAHTQLGLRRPSHASAHAPAKSAGRPPAGPKVGVRRHVIRQVVVLEVAGPLSQVVDDLNRAIQLALADGPRGVVCDLSEVLEDVEPAAVKLLATAGRHVRDWPAVPVAVASPDQNIRGALATDPLGRHLMVTTSMFSAVSAILAAPTLDIERRHLTPHPTAPRAARDFVTRTLLDWRLGRAIPFASLVVSEMVSSSTIHSGTDIDLSVSWNLGALRLTVRDHSPDLPRQRHSALDLNGRGVTVVAGLARAFGVLPTTAGGKVVWAVLNAARPRPPITSPRAATPLASATQLPSATSGAPVPAAAHRESPLADDTASLAT